MPDSFGNGRQQMQRTGRRRKGRALQTDRPTESGIGLLKKKSGPYRLTTGIFGSIRNIRALAIQQRCALLVLPRRTYYYAPRPESAENLRLMRRLDELYLDCPSFGSRRMAVMLGVNRGLVRSRIRRSFTGVSLCRIPCALNWSGRALRTRFECGQHVHPHG